jgi:mono/diheme cytochrome c family protein
MPRLAIAILAILPILSPAQQAPPATSQANQDSGRRGELLFTGATRFRNGGPACISCHTIAGTGFPSGGTLGPDLTHSYGKLGPSGTQTAMQTLFFPVMTPIYRPHSLFPDEQADLLAYLEHAESRSQPEWATQIILLAAVLLAGSFIALTGFLYRDRVKSVRRALVERATSQGARF